MGTPRPETPRYHPAPYLTTSPGSFLSATELVYYFQDFHTSLEYVGSAPQFVFERLVANLRGPVRGSIQKVRDELQRVGSEKLVAKVAEFESSLVEVEPDQRQIANLESRVAHQEVLQSSNDRLTADLAELRTSYWTISRPAIGTFHKNGSGEVSKAITFTRPMPVPPVLAPGLTPFCLSGFAYPFVLSHAKNIKKHGFDVSIVPRATPQAQPYTIWGELGSVSCSWLELGPDDLDFQCGQFDISGDTDGMSRKAQTDGKSLSHARTLSHH